MWRKHTFKQTALFSLVFSISFGLFAPALTANAISDPGGGGGAATIASSMTPTQSAESYVLFNALSVCIAKKGADLNGSLKTADVLAGNWFDNPKIGAVNPRDGYFLTGAGVVSSSNTGNGGENVGCGGNNTDWILAAATLWGYVDSAGNADPVALLCAAGAQREDGLPCTSGSDGKYDNHTLELKTFQNNVSVKIGGTPSLTAGSAAEYALYEDVFKAGCLGAGNQDPWTKTGDETNPHFYKDVQFVDTNGTLTTANYIGQKAQSDSIYVYTQPNGADFKTTCKAIAQKMNNDAVAYASVVASLPNGDSATPAGPATGGTNSDSNTCGSSVTGLGWIVCPVINAVAGLNDTLWSIIQSMLTINPLSQGSAIYNAWGAIRSLANAIFVLFFMVIIFSQLTGAGITNYGVKKMLPKIIIAAILVNVSFIIMQAAVDLSNIIGMSLYNLIHSLIPNTGQKTWKMLLDSLTGAGFTVLGGGIAVALVAGSATGFWMIVPFILMGLLALAAAFLTLAFRQAALPILAILAPLAFVAYLLPNTETWFKKWRGLLMSMLMLYPLAAVIFAGAQFASVIIIGNGGNFLNYLIGLTVLALPLFSLPFLARQGGAIQSKVVGALNGMVQKARPGISNMAKERADAARARYQNDQRPDPTTRFGKALRRIEPRRANRAMAARSRVREMETETNKAGFESQIARDQVRGVLGKDGGSTIQGAQAKINLQDAKRETGIDTKNTESRSVIRNRNNINEREWESGQMHEGAESKRDELIAENRELDSIRLRTDHAKGDTKEATSRAEIRTEKVPGTFENRARVAAAEGALEIAHEQTKGDVVAASTDEWAKSAAASSLTVAERAELHDQKLAQKVATSATAANTGVAEQEMARVILTPDSSGGPSIAAQDAAGVSGAAGVSRARAAASQSIDKQNADHVTAAQILLAKSDVGRDDVRELAEGRTATGKDGDMDGGADLAMREAAIKKMVASNDVEGIQTVWDGLLAGTGLPAEEETVLRDTFAESLMASSQKPVYYGAGIIEAMRINDPTRFTSTHTAIAKAIDDGAYSPAKLVSSDQDELLEIIKLGPPPDGSGLLDPGLIAKLKADANTAMTDSRLAPGLAKNRDNIAKINGW